MLQCCSFVVFYIPYSKLYFCHFCPVIIVNLVNLPRFYIELDNEYENCCLFIAAICNRAGHYIFAL